jgi:hypothetical protein
VTNNAAATATILRSSIPTVIAPPPARTARRAKLATPSASAHASLDNTNDHEHQAFLAYPTPLAARPIKATFCAPPFTIARYLSTEVAAFAPNFVTPRVHQASLNIGRELAERFAGGISYMNVHGQNLIRACDVNLLTPVDVTHPVYDESGKFIGAYYDVPSFSTCS